MIIKMKKLHSLLSAWLRRSSLLAVPLSLGALHEQNEELSTCMLDEITETVKNTYNQPVVALNYSSMRDANAPNMLFLQKYLESIRDAVGEQCDHLNLLDLGCGTGATMSKTIECTLKQMANVTSCDIIGIDIAETMLKVADQHLQFCLNERFRKDVNLRNDMITNYHLFEGDMRDLCDIIDSDKRFHGIVSFYAIIHVPRQQHVSIFNQCWRLLEEDGILCVCVGAEDLRLDYGEWDGQPMYWSHFDRATSLQLIEDCNFEIIEATFIRESLSDDPNCGHLFVLAKKRAVRREKKNKILN